MRVFLKEWREHCGLSQQDVGDRLTPPIDKATVSRWETLRRGLSLDVLAAYAEAIGVPASALYRMPNQLQSLDELIADAPDDLKRRAREVVTVLVKPER